MKTTKNIKNSEYRAIPVVGGFEVWLISFSSGAKLAKASGSNVIKTEQAALEFIEWVKVQELKYLK